MLDACAPAIIIAYGVGRLGVTFLATAIGAVQSR